jgi:hypothetical protein
MIYHKIEQINVSDSEYKITYLNGHDGELVEKGLVLFSYESSKSTTDIEAENDCYVYFNPAISLDSDYPVDTIVAVSSEEKISTDELGVLFNASASSKTQINDDVIVTNKAKLLIESNNLDISLFEGLEVINEEIVLNIIKKDTVKNDFQEISYYHNRKDFSTFSKPLKRLAIIGAGKAALQLLDAVVEAKEHTPVLLYDNNDELIGKQILGLPVRSKVDFKLIKQDFSDGLFDEIIVSFSGNIQARKDVFAQLLELEIPIANVIHPTAQISNYSQIGTGNLIFANVRIGPFAKIENNNVLSAYCSIEHHNYLGSHNTFGPSVLFSGSCTIHDCNKFGTGIFIEPNVTIGFNNIISSGVVLTTNVKENTLVKNLAKYKFIDLKQS